MKFKLALASAICAIGLAGCASSGMQAPSQQVFFVGIADGAVVSSPVKVKFGVTGLTVKPALEDIDNKNAGHHHLLVNLDSLAEGQGIPFTDQHIHFGKGQTEADVILPPGRYKLTMQFANGAHMSYGKRLSQTISITVR